MRHYLGVSEKVSKNPLIVLKIGYNKHNMGKKPLFELIIGGDYLAQPKHKQKIIPVDFLSIFRNVNANDLNEIVDFANSHSFSGYIIPDMAKSLEEKFADIQSRYSCIIDRILLDGSIGYDDILLINHDLENTSPEISLREKINDLPEIEEDFSVYVMESSGDEKAVVEVAPIGSFDVGKYDKKATCMKVNIRKPANSKTQWSCRQIKDGVTKISEIFPDEKWMVNRKYLGSVVLTDIEMELDNIGRPISIEMKFRLGKTTFKKEELAATWSPTTGESFIAKRIWDYLNSKYEGDKFKLCKICGDLHSGNSEDHCREVECKKDWDAIRKKPMKRKIRDKLK
ncbi:MAG: hypothetical protein WCG99_03600 [Candidatus Berkelbacteria bacterium]